MAIRRYSVVVPVDAAGAATAYSPKVSGKVCQIIYTKSTYADGVDFTITAEETGETIWTESDVNATAFRSPRAATATTAGVAALYAASGAVNTKLSLDTDRIKIVIAAGGVSMTGTFTFVLED